MLCGAILAACGKGEGGMPGALEARVNYAGPHWRQK
jgi:hypothetical protein